LLNGIWLGLIIASVVCAAWSGTLDAVKLAALDGAKQAVELLIGLVGAMALFLGLMRVAQQGGLLHAVARGLAPLLRRLFPDVPTDHPAMGAMIMNLASNVLGLGNAATPFGLKAMVELDKLNETPGRASDSMALFLAINATSISLFPLGVITARASLGSRVPDAIWLPTLIATTASTLTAVLLCFTLRRLRYFSRAASGDEALASAREAGARSEPKASEVNRRAAAQQPDRPQADSRSEAEPSEAQEDALQLSSPVRGGSAGARLLIGATLLLLAVALARQVFLAWDTTSPWELAKSIASSWFLPVFILSLVLVGVAGGVRVYEVAAEGAKEGLEVAARILPFLVMILSALAMLRASGALDALVGVLDPLTRRVGFPAEALPMALLRPLSGSGAYGVMVDIMKAHGPDSFVGILAGSLQGSTETTFYVLTLYLGAARVRDARYALPACLGGDLAGFAAATAACHWLFG
jgi:spore maturation protein SpmA